MRRRCARLACEVARGEDAHGHRSERRLSSQT
jgi:hypothetical protein